MCVLSGIVSRYLFSPLVTIPVAPVITGMMHYFIFHICWISILRFLYFNLFSVSFCVTFLSDCIATSIKKQVLSVFKYYVWHIGQNLSARTPWFHNTLIISCSHTTLGMCEHQFSVVLMPNSCILSNADMCRLYHVLWCNHSLQKWGIWY
jgi:hypothetical protein